MADMLREEELVRDENALGDVVAEGAIEMNVCVAAEVTDSDGVGPADINDGVGCADTV